MSWKSKIDKQGLPTMVQNSRAPVTKDAMISMSDNITVNPMIILSKPNEFAFNRPEAWRFWKERFLRFGRLAVRQWEYSERDWIDMLCYTMGEKSEEIMEQIMPDVADKNLADVLQAFTDYFGRNMRNVTLQRYRFNSRIQLPDESVEQFITVLHILAGSCQYGIMKDELIRDRIVAGLSDNTILEKLQLEACLTLENVLAIAREAEIQRSQHDGVSQDSSSTGEINCAVERSEEQQFLSDKSNDSKSLDQEGKYNSCRKTGDLEIDGKPKSVSCAKEKDGQISAEKDNKDCDMEHDQQTHSSVDKVQNTVAIPDHLPCNSHRPGQLELGDADANDKEAHVKTAYEIMQPVMNDLRRQNFVESVNQIGVLEINSEAALQIVVAMIHEEAVDEPSFSEALAVMCKKLAIRQVSSHNSEVDKKKCLLNFKKLIMTLCQTEFEKNTVDQHARAVKMKEIEACVDPNKKKELQQILTKYERRIRIKSIGNIRFIGELFKQRISTTSIVHECIRHLLTQTDEESLECLCKLLSTTGKDLESKNQNLDEYFKQMLDIVNGKVPSKVSSRARFMLQDVIKLRTNKWVPRRDDSNAKTMDQIPQEARTERSDTHMNNTPLNTSRKDDRNSDRKQNPNGEHLCPGGISQFKNKLASTDYDCAMELKNKRLKH